MSPQDRLDAIDKLVGQFEQSLSDAERSLMDRLASTAKQLLDNPANIAFVLRDWAPDWAAVIQNLAAGILDVADLNAQYFAALSVGPDVLRSSRNDLLTAVGLTTAGVLIEGGYLSTILRDTSVGRKLVSLLTDAKLRKTSELALVSKLNPLVRGKGPDKGVLGKLFDTLDVQPHLEADRVMQQAVGTRADLKARLYLGGLIDGSRPFCAARNTKVFLDSEIARFGTPSDTYGGYDNKSTGHFAGKPKAGYDPFTQCGGYGCRHHWNVISNAEALRRRDDLEEINGVLRIKKA